LTSIPQTSAASSGVLPNDAAQPVHYQDDEVPEPPEETSEDDSPVPTGSPATTIPEPAPPVPLAKEKGPRMRYEEVIYKDEHGNVIPKAELEKLLAEQGENVEFRTVYETQTKILRPGEEPPKGARVVGNVGGGGEVPEYPVGQNPETEEKKGGEKKAYRTGK